MFVTHSNYNYRTDLALIWNVYSIIVHELIARINAFNPEKKLVTAEFVNPGAKPVKLTQIFYLLSITISSDFYQRRLAA